MRSRWRVGLLAVLLVAAASPGRAAKADVLVGFQTPSGNIHCLYSSDSTGIYLRCDLGVNDAPPVRVPADCELDYGNAFEMASRGKAARACVGDTVAVPTNPVLGYGRTWKRGGFSCLSATAGLTCRNAVGRGFFLSRRAQRLF